MKVLREHMENITVFFSDFPNYKQFFIVFVRLILEKWGLTDLPGRDEKLTFDMNMVSRSF